MESALYNGVAVYNLFHSEFLSSPSATWKNKLLQKTKHLYSNCYLYFLKQSLSKHLYCHILTKHIHFQVLRFIWPAEMMQVMKSSWQRWKRGPNVIKSSLWNVICPPSSLYKVLWMHLKRVSLCFVHSIHYFITKKDSTNSTNPNYQTKA